MRNPYLTLAKRFLAHFSIIFLVEQQFLLAVAYAQTLPIVVDGTTNTQVTQTASGVDQVNIAAPNDSGLSHNKFSEYNVNQSGQIINNFSGRDAQEIVAGSGATAVTATQIGGLVAVNQNLVNSGSARLILNEVTSGNVSQLLGYTEIAGSKADLILANPNGIACNGCGFINTAHLVMVAGSSNYDDRGNLGFDLKEQSNRNLYVPLITVDGLGLDATMVDSAEIIASSVKLLSTIYGSDANSVTIRTGEGSYDYATKNIAPSLTSLDPLAPVFAIDASALAKIEAGRVYLIATKQGVGVKMEGEILASSTLNIDANGDVYYQKIAVGEAADLKSTAKIEGLEIAAPNLVVQANEFHNLGDVSARNLTLQNSAILNNDGNLAALNLVISNVNQINNHNTIYGENSLNISGGNLTNSALGTIYSLNDYAINLSSIVDSGILTNSGLITAETNLTINANRLINNSEISAKDGLSLDISGFASNSGNIISNHNLNLTSSSLTNSNNISAGYLNVTVNYTLQNDGLIFSNHDSSVNAGSLINAGNILVNGNLNLNVVAANNNGDIFSGEDLAVTATNLTNSSDIQSSGKITLNVESLTNSKNIISTKDFAINATNISNSSILKSRNDFVINAVSFSNAASSLILAQNNLILHATNIDNRNTKPSVKTINSGIVAVDGNVNLRADVLNNNSGIIVGKSTNLTSLNAPNVNLSNTLGAFISTTSINLNLGALDYTITGTVTASDVDITAANIINQGNVTATDFISLNAIAGNITNGFAVGDNSNVQLAAGSYVNLTASNSINNYGKIIATTDLTLTATGGDVNNYSGARIQGGSGTETINATSGSFNNIASSSLLTSDNNAIFNVRDLNNSGEISVANDLTANVSHDLNNNATALIWANNDAKFYVVNNFTNMLADIYANNDLVIQKNVGADKNYSVKNISGRIETLEGDITINTITFENKRSSDPVNKYLSIPNAYTDSVMPNWVFITSWDQGNNDENHYYVYDASNALNSNSISAQIFSGNNLTLNSSSFTNNMSEIYSVGDANITYQTDFANNSSSSLVGNLEYLYIHAWDRLYHVYSDLDQGGLDISSTLSNYIVTFPAYIKSGGAMTIAQNGVGSATFLNSGTTMQLTTIGSIASQSHSTNIGHLDTYTLSDTGIVAIDLTSISSVITDAQALNPGSPTDPTFSGAFKVNLDPSATTPLIESRSQFTDASSFFGSAYYFTALGLNASSVLDDLDRQTRITNLRMLGDAFVEERLILDKLKALTNNSLFLSKTTTDPHQQIKELLDNAAAEMARLGLDAEDVAVNGLTAAQTNSLNRDIITFEITTVNGYQVLAPKIYLSQATRDNLLNQNMTTGGVGLATNSTIFAKGNLTVNATGSDLVNNGSIGSAGNVSMNVASLTNRTNSVTQSQIIAGNNLTVSSVGNIKNLGANIGAVGNVTLTSTSGNILNSALVATNDKTLLDSNSDSYVSNGFAQRSVSNTAGFGGGEISSQLLSNAAIKGGAVTINAANDFTNLAANVAATQNSLVGGGTSSGNVVIAAGDDVMVSTLELRNRVEASWGNRRRGGTSVSDTTTNVGSTISGAGNISFTTTGLGADSETAEQTLSGSSILVYGSNVNATGNLTINSADNLIIANAVNSSYRDFESHKRGATRRSDSAQIDYVETAVSSSLRGNNINISSGRDTLIQGSDINATNNLLIGSFTIAQNLDGSYKKDSYGNYVTVDNTTVDNLTIRNAQLSEYHYANTSRGYSGIAASGMRALTYSTIGIDFAADYIKKEAAILLPDNIETSLTHSFEDYSLPGIAYNEYEHQRDNLSNTHIRESSSSRTDISNVVASNIHVGGSMMTNSVGDTTITGSNIDIGGNLLANSLGNFTVNAATKTEKTSETNSYETAGQFHSNLNVARANYRGGVIKEFDENGSESTSSTLVSSNINVGGSTLINSGDLFALTASNLTTTGSTEINSLNNLNISDGSNKLSTSYFDNKLTIDTGVQVGNAYVDAGHAALDAVDALKKVKDAKDKLDRIEKLHDEDRASSKAVERAKYQVALAMLNAGMMTAAAFQAMTNTGTAASNSFATGFYGSAYADINSTKYSSSSELTQSVSSNLTSGNSIALTSGNGDINITGSNLSSINGDLNLTAMLGNINVKAGESTYSQETKTSSRNGGGSVGSNGYTMNIGFSEGGSSIDQTIYTNARLNAEHGVLKLNSKQDTNIVGANLLASDIILNVQGNLLVKSKQNLTESDSYNIGANVGVNGGQSAVQNSARPGATPYSLPTPSPETATYHNPTSGGLVGGNYAFNFGNSEGNRAWVDNVTSIIGTNSVTINVKNNTNIVGAEIANVSNGIDYGNLVLNTGTLTYSNLENYNNSDSMSFSYQRSYGFNPNNPTVGTNANNVDPNNSVQPANGRRRFDLSLNGNESSSTTNATIGKGTVRIGADIAFHNDNTNLTNYGDVASVSGGETYDQNNISNLDGQVGLSGLNRDVGNVESNKRDVITSDFDTTVTVDDRAMAAASAWAGARILDGAAAVADIAGATQTSVRMSAEAYDLGNVANVNWGSYWGDTVVGARMTGVVIKEGSLFTGNNLKTVREFTQDNVPIVGTFVMHPISAVEGTIFTFLEQKDVPGGAQAFIYNPYTKEITLTTDVSKTKNYGLNGINTTLSNGLDNYFAQEDKDNNLTFRQNITFRYNPTHGAVGDLVESGLGKIAQWLHVPEAIAMNRIASEDMYARKDIADATNLFHSQATIIGVGAMSIYANNYMKPLTITDPVTGEVKIIYTNQINQSQKFVAVGPAVLKYDWTSSVGLLGDKIKENSDWQHHENDPVLDLAAPSNLINDVARFTTGKEINSPIYIPNFIISTPRGVWNAIMNMDTHGVINPKYSIFINENNNDLKEVSKELSN